MIVYILLALVPLLAAGQSHNVVLRIETGGEGSVYLDEPIVLTTSITNSQAQKNAAWNQAADEWMTKKFAEMKAGKISKEEYEKEAELVTKGKRLVKIDTIGTKENPWFGGVRFHIYKDSAEVEGWPLELLGRSYTDSVAILDEKGYYLVRHHVPPEKVRALQPGNYRVTAEIAGKVSNVAALRILGTGMPEVVLNKKETQLRLGKYYVQALDAERAMMYADRVLKDTPADIGGLILRGEAFIIKEEFGKSLEAFEKALLVYDQIFGQDDEPPDYIIGMIDWLKEKQ